MEKIVERANAIAIGLGGMVVGFTLLGTALYIITHIPH